MSYNLMAEGDLDLFELAQRASRYEPIELFPIPAEPPATRAASGALAPDGLGIAIASSQVGPPAAAALRSLVEFLWSKEAAVYDLYTGKRVKTNADLAEVEERIT